MFELLGSRRHLTRAALLATISLGAWSGFSSEASAQLRSGRAERPLYYGQMEEEASEPPIARPKATTRPSTRARTASTRGRLVADGPARSIVEKGDGQDAVQPEPTPPSVPAPAHPRAHSAQPEPLPFDDSMTTFAEEYSEGHHGGCGCSHCRKERYFADLAPGCCESSCGPSPVGCGGLFEQLLCNMSVRGEVPLFWRRGIGLPPLVTTATAGTAANVAGQLGNANTRLLVGNQLATEDSEVGVRISVGSWFDPQQYRGVIVRYMNAGDQDTQFAFDSNSTPILARPIDNITTGTATADTQLIAFPGESTGTIRVGTSSSIDGFDIVMRRLAYRDRFTRVDWLVGYQHTRIAESLTVNSNTTVIGNAAPLAGTSIAVSDQIRTKNNFNGAVLGLMSQRQFACWKFEAMGRLGLGSLEREYSASGSTTTTSAAGNVTTEDQGLLVRNTNNQTRVNDTFVVAPEWGVNAGYFLTPNLDVTVGYSYLMIGKVAQPGRQVDRTVNLSDPLTGFLRPGFVLNTDKYWLHSLNLGLQYRY